MKTYLISLAIGLFVGLIYGLLGVRSPAPPVVALIGLLGILAGEQIPTMAKALWAREPLAVSWLQQVRPHVFGQLPGSHRRPVDLAAQTPPAAPRRAEGPPTRSDQAATKDVS
ncbi:MAG TPA: XapX domain-containing protein [Caulobacteraceae bacterium]|nr:XapX domain-containing protein [Caulobacteraceae bacterium]